MRILMITDMEGVSGVKNATEWLKPGDRCYEAGCRLLTREVNAAVDGFFAGGAKYVQVVDGHGAGGIDIELLDERVEYARGGPDGIDSSYTGIAFVGQHAKASTEYAHLAHTQCFQYIDLSVNGVSIGEFGQTALCGSELGVPVFFASGDLAFTAEAQALVPGITICAVKRGVTRGTGEDCTTSEYEARNAGAVHIAPARVNQIIRQSAEDAIRKLAKKRPPLVPLQPPFEAITILRPDKHGDPKRTYRTHHATSVIALMNEPLA